MWTKQVAFSRAAGLLTAAYDSTMDTPDPVARGWMALLAGAWQEARGAFEEALEQRRPAS
jgi:hypothetical protein